MDIQDVSAIDEYASMVQQARVNAQRADRRKGEIPKDHPPAFLQVQFYMIQYHYRMNSGADVHHIITTQIPAAYPPCTRSAAELEPISISQLQLETHHRGSRIVVRVMVPASRINAVMAVVEDEKGTATLLQVYHQPEESVVPAAEILHRGACYLIKEPFFKATTSDGTYSIRVDHPGDLVPLRDGDELIPASWRECREITNTSQGIRNKGNDAVGRKSWAEAERLYTMAIAAAQTTEEEQVAYLNRSLANLRLGRPAIALSDAVKGGGGSGTEHPSEKGLFRGASALYQLGDFEQCLKKLELNTATYPSGTSMQETRTMIDRAKARLREKQTGEYNFSKMLKQAKATPPLIDCATYSAPVEIRESPGRGRGLFTTRKVSAGELLLCEKAFGYSYASVEEGGSTTTLLMNITTKTIVAGGQATLLTRLVQKAYHDADAAKALAGLYHGDYKPVAVAEADGKPVVDSFLVEKVMSLNVFGAPRTSRESVELRTNPTSNGDEKDLRYTTCGIWYIASHINHACVSNCRRSFIGDMQIVRATRDIDADTELFFWYQTPRAFESYAETQKHLEQWGFTCDCAICQEKKSTPNALNAKRKALKHELKRALGSTPRTANIPKTLQTLRRLEQTYPATAREPGAVRLDAWEAYLAVGTAYLSKGDRLQVVDSTLRGLEALGFVITACPRRKEEEEEAKKPHQERCLEITRWGVATELAVNALLNVAEAYSGIAPELSGKARRYAEIAYAMVVGERETFLVTYPAWA